MKYIVDAQLPQLLADILTEKGFDTIHTLNLPLKNATGDTEINRISIEEERVVITKDIDFLDSILLKSIPFKLLLVTTGNIKNRQLLDLFRANISEIDKLLSTNKIIEISIRELIVRL